MKLRDSPKKMAEDLDDAMYGLDPYGYMDAVCEPGEDLETSRRRNKSSLAEAIKMKDKRVLDDVRCTCDWIDETEDRPLIKRFKGIFTRLENHYGSKR